MRREHQEMGWVVLAVLLAGCGAANDERASGPALSVTTQGLAATGAAERELRKKAEQAGVALPGEKLTFCYGWNEDAHQCLLYVGSKQACASLRPCLWATRAAPATRLPAEADTFCQGLDRAQTCQTYLGTQQMCASLSPCQTAATTSVEIRVSDPHFCYGFDEDTNQCLLYYGSKAACDSLTPCW